jgi:gliding motility-associated-like protein
MKHKLTLLLAFTLISPLAWAQGTPTIMPQVLNSAGDHRQLGTSAYWITDNVGEPFIQSNGYGVLNMMITEGFLQPEKVTPTGFSLTALQQNIQCLDKEDDAFIALTLTSTVSKYDVNYLWTPSSVCPNNNCAKLDTLKPGIYSVKVAITFTTNVGIIKHDTISKSFVIDNATQPCIVKVFSGITANSDNQNEVFTVENIKEFPKNHVSIFNRWGNMLFETDGYNMEQQGKRWPEKEDLEKLTSSTYFYIIQLGDGSGKVLKGWVELIIN